MTTPLFIDHAVVTDLPVPTPLGSPPVQADQRFWAAPARTADSPLTEALEITLSGPRLINRVSFDLSRYPCLGQLQYYNDQTQQWLACHNTLNLPLGPTILQSVPAVLPQLSAVPGHLHPQHAFLGHWERFDYTLKPVLTSRLRLLLTRTLSGAVPLDRSGNAVAYSLAVSNFLLGYAVDSPDAVPRSSLAVGSLSEHDVFATTDDPSGATIGFALRQGDANTILGNTEAEADLIWRCEGQPFAEAVVNFYADLRDGKGQPQVIDRIFLDPLNTGAHITLYYSSDVPVGGFDPVSDPLTRDQALPVVDSPVVGGVLTLGSDSEFIRIDNGLLGHDPSLPWWLGLQCQPTGVTQTSGMTPVVLFSCTSWALALTGTGIQLSTATDTVSIPLAWQFASPDASYSSNVPIAIYAAYDGTNLTLHALTSADEEQASVAVSVAIAATTEPYLYLGAQAPSTPGGTPSAFTPMAITALVLKEEIATSGGEDFLTDPGSFCVLTLYAQDDPPQTQNTLLRLDASMSQVDDEHPTGLVGGPAAKYAQMSWTPITRDYTMQRGWLHLPPTKARFVKFEITNLVMEYRDIAYPVTTVVKTFPQAMIEEFLAASEGADPPVPTGLDIEVQNPTTYLDQPQFGGTGGTLSGMSNAEVYVATNHDTAERLRTGRGEQWNYRSWHTDVRAPRFSTPGVHVYRTDQVTSTIKIVYVAGLRQLIFARASLNAAFDSPVYDDAFHDLANISTASWTLDPDNGGISSGSGIKAVAQSVPFRSVRPVRGLQFATQQSPPTQLLPDPDFDDPTLSTWALVGDAQIPQQTIVRSDLLGNVVELVRDSRVAYWGDIGPVYGTWANVVTAGLSYEDLSVQNNEAQAFGGIASVQVAQPSGGRLYAAARVAAPADLSEPLTLQIIDSVTGAVLSEESVPVHRDQITEWWTGLAVAENGDATSTSWGTLSGGASVVRPSFADSFTRANAAALGRMDSGQAWIGSNPLSIVSNQAKVTSAGQESFLNPGEHWGTMTVTFGNAITTGTLAASVPMVGLGGAHLMNDGRIVDRSTGSTLATLTAPAAGDVWKFQFLPTSYVPGGQLSGGVDPTIKTWSIIITVNGTFVTTLSRVLGFGWTKSLAGALNQTYAAWSWVPTYQSDFAGTFITGLPMPDDGIVSPTDSTSWYSSTGRRWVIDQPFTVTPGAASVNYAHAAAANWSTTSLTGIISTDVVADYGALEFVLTQFAPTVSRSTYLLAQLERTSNSLGLRADGSLVRQDGTVISAGVCPGIAAGSRITIRFARVADLSSAFKTTWSISGSNVQALIFLLNDTVVGVYSAISIWANTLRAICGFTDGTNYTIITGWSWTPDAANTTPDIRASTYDGISAGETLTWAGLATTTVAVTHPVQARLLQQGATRDTFYVDTLSLFSDPVVWEFSNDGGASFVRAYDIRNDPHGVVLFDPPAITNLNSIANQLVYRLTGYGADVAVSHLTIRPWYEGFLYGVPTRPERSYHGPNVNPWEHYPPIEEDPRFQTWHYPIPRDWFFAFRPLDVSQAATDFVYPVLTDNVVLP